jgi:hypothetical protein
MVFGRLLNLSQLWKKKKKKKKKKNFLLWLKQYSFSSHIHNIFIYKFIKIRYKSWRMVFLSVYINSFLMFFSNIHQINDNIFTKIILIILGISSFWVSVGGSFFLYYALALFANCVRLQQNLVQLRVICLHVWLARETVATLSQAVIELQHFPSKPSLYTWPVLFD